MSFKHEEVAKGPKVQQMKSCAVAVRSEVNTIAVMAKRCRHDCPTVVSSTPVGPAAWDDWIQEKKPKPH